MPAQALLIGRSPAQRVQHAAALIVHQTWHNAPWPVTTAAEIEVSNLGCYGQSSSRCSGDTAVSETVIQVGTVGKLTVDHNDLMVHHLGWSRVAQQLCGMPTA